MEQIIRTADLGQLPEFVGEADALMGFALVDEEPLVDAAAAKIVKGINDIAKAVPDGHVSKTLRVDLTRVEALAGAAQRFVDAARALPGGVLQMLAQAKRKGQGEFVHPDEIARLALQPQQRTPEREFVRGGVKPQEDEGSPMVLHRGLDVEEAGHGTACFFTRLYDRAKGDRARIRACEGMAARSSSASASAAGWSARPHYAPDCRRGRNGCAPGK